MCKKSYNRASPRHPRPHGFCNRLKVVIVGRPPVDLIEEGIRDLDLELSVLQSPHRAKVVVGGVGALRPDRNLHIQIVSLGLTDRMRDRSDDHWCSGSSWGRTVDGDSDMHDSTSAEDRRCASVWVVAQNRRSLDSSRGGLHRVHHDIQIEEADSRF